MRQHHSAKQANCAGRADNTGRDDPGGAARIANPVLDLLGGVDYARRQAGVSVVSMSWGSSEFPGENFYDGYFTTPGGHRGVTFVASSGDDGTTSWPATSTNVLAVGGTTLSLNSAGGY